MTRLVTALALAMLTGCRRQTTTPADASVAQPVAVADVVRPSSPAYCAPASILAIAAPNEFVDALAHDIDLRGHGDDFARLTETEQMLASVVQLDRQIRRGGFAEYFSQSMGDHASEAIAGLHRIGANESASIAERGVSVFGLAGAPRDRATRVQQITSLGEGTHRFWAALDGVYLHSHDDVDALLSVYARAETQARCPREMH